MTAKDTVRTLLDCLPDDCTLDDVQYHLYVVQAVARGEADEKAGRTPFPTNRLTQSCAASGCSDAPGNLGRLGAPGARRGCRLHLAGIARRCGPRLTRALDTAASLSTLAERGRMVQEVGDSALRELLVYDYRMLYRAYEDRVVIRAFLHGARNFSKWRRAQASEL